ncbi:hypothetical protein [Lacticaseibacillus brantae]|uniref:PepSY domain-containing protein n=1 Tax=Lacticaseibacillus brantae DSM 23927 TaxID=1423727 RepID=A0A0R2B055_9LACO|nr:hypothetical protein [Lacticaseibacillus brantae]KRM72894.1 hypothetical protein FC34_GL000606 [Lacticaseibacillus brantae DSM 23927]
MKKPIIITTVAAIGAAIAIQAHHRYVHYTRPKALLNQIKQDFLVDGPIAGAWIDHDPKPFEVHHHDIPAYYAGVTRETETGLQQYSIIISAKGTILASQRLA